ncbi:MAG: 1,4-alpha-glucan branching enzyme, partial [Verrucomicrobiota bacterium]
MDAEGHVSKAFWDAHVFTDFDAHLLKEGNHFRLYDKLGAHLTERDGVKGVRFAVWAPNAAQVSVIGDFNGWARKASPLVTRRDETGIWEGFIPFIGHGQVYKYAIRTKQGWELEKADPMGFHSEVP